MQTFIIKNHWAGWRPLVSATPRTLGPHWDSSSISCCYPVSCSSCPQDWTPHPDRSSAWSRRGRVGLGQLITLILGLSLGVPGLVSPPALTSRLGSSACLGYLLEHHFWGTVSSSCKLPHYLWYQRLQYSACLRAFLPTQQIQVSIDWRTKHSLRNQNVETQNYISICYTDWYFFS